MKFLGFVEVLFAFAAYYIENFIASLDFNTQLTAALTAAAVNITVAGVSLLIAVYRFRWMRSHFFSNVFHLLLAVCGCAIAIIEMMKIGFGLFVWMPEFLPSKVAWTVFLMLIVEESLTLAKNNFVELEYVDILGRVRVASPIPFLVSLALCLCVWSFVVYSSAGAPLQSRSDVQWKSYGNQTLVVREEMLLKKNIDGAVWQKKQKMHLSMYEDDQCASERLRCSQRLISFKEHSRKSREESSSSDFQTDEDNKQYDYTADSPTYLSNSSYHQADLPEFQGKDYESESKWLGTEVWPLDVAEQRKTTLIQRERIGKGRQGSCGCQFVGSTECVRFHIREKRLKLKLELGSAF